MHVRFGRENAAAHSGDLTAGGRRGGGETVTGVTRRPTIPARRASLFAGLIPTDPDGAHSDGQLKENAWRTRLDRSRPGPPACW